MGCIKLKAVARLALAGMLAAAPLMTGCMQEGPRGYDGEDGEQGEQGEPGQDGQDGAQGVPGTQYVLLNVEMPKVLKAEITKATVVDGKPVVSFKVTDGAGRGAVGIGPAMTFAVAKLVPGTNGSPDQWKSYINRLAEKGALKKDQGTTEKNGTLVDNKDGTYTYTFATDLTTVTSKVNTTEKIGYDPALTLRVALQANGTLNGFTVSDFNATFDFVPNGGTPVKRDIAENASCLKCHDQGTFGFHSAGARRDMKYCVVCHNPSTVDPDTGNSVDMTEMTHKIHAAHFLAEQAEAAGQVHSYKIIGNAGSVHDYSHVTYPQPLNNCRTCHDGADAATPQGDNWKNKPSKEACGSCHTIDWAAAHPAGPTGQVRSNNAACIYCHNADSIEKAHVGETKTANSTVPAGAFNFTYEIKDVTVNGSDQPVITFKVKKDGADFNVLDPGSAIKAGTGPSFLVVYGATGSAEWTNFGRKAGQPARIALKDLLPGAATPKGTLTGPVGGYFTATLTDATAKFPSGAAMRAVAMEGYYTQILDGADFARHTPSAYKQVTGDKARRVVVEDAKCATCHESLELHGGNRVANTMVCATCHNPNLSSSGRTANPAHINDPANASYKNALVAAGYGNLDNDPATAPVFDEAAVLQFPETSLNFKDMVHAIHAGHMRNEPYTLVRNYVPTYNRAEYFDFSHVTYPASLNNCTACHKDGTFYGAPAGNLVTTYVTLPETMVGTTPTSAEIGTARSQVDNTTDLVTTANAAACGTCHDSVAAVAHMMQNGGKFQSVRSDVGASQYDLETCSLCHGTGKTADVKVVHSKSAAH